MTDAPPDGDKRPIARPRAQPRSIAQRRRRKRWNTLIIGSGMLLVAVVTTVMVIAAETLISRQSSRAPRIASAAPDSDVQTAKITKDFGGKDCSQEIFNNQTGRTTRSPKPCEATALDGNGVPIPLGTIHRLDAISKSFPGN
jgi:hypothetical protein